jgi:hypothetical protein
MARRPVPPPKPRSPILTAGQKRRRIERLQKCITSLEAFDPQEVRKRFGNPEVLALEAAIDKALSSAFGYGTPAYMRYNQAATLDPGPVITNAALHGSVLRPVRGPGRHEAQAQEARHYFSDGRERSIALLRKAIGTLEDEIAAAQPVIQAPKKSKAPEKVGEAAQPVLEAPKGSKASQKTGEVLQVQPKRRGGIDLKAAWRRVGRWWGGRN